MHPDTCWMICQADTTARHQQVHAADARQYAAYPRFHRHIAMWSGQYVLRLAHWLLRYGQSATQQPVRVQH